MAATSVVRFGKHLKELRLHLCQSSPQSQGAREFIEKHYVNIKKNNPTFPILIRECKGVNAKLHARYAFGNECSVMLADKTSNEVLQAVECFANKTEL